MSGERVSVEQGPYELIVLDGGSLDGTREFLDGMAIAAPVRVEVVHAPPTEKLSAGVQQCLQLAQGEAVVLLQNDTVVVHDWLYQMTALAAMDATIGVVGPMTSYLAPPQGVETIPYSLAQIQRILAGWTTPRRLVRRPRYRG